MRKVFVVLVLLALFPKSALSSSANATVETGVVTGGKVDIRQSVEVTVNGQTRKLESTGPGKLELKMEQTGSASPTVTFTQVSPSGQAATQTSSFALPLVEFFRKLFSNLVSWFK